jgi:hypothetical protein
MVSRINIQNLATRTLALDFTGMTTVAVTQKTALNKTYKLAKPTA